MKIICDCDQPNHDPDCYRYREDIVKLRKALAAADALADYCEDPSTAVIIFDGKRGRLLADYRQARAEVEVE